MENFRKYWESLYLLIILLIMGIIVGIVAVMSPKTQQPIELIADSISTCTQTSTGSINSRIITSCSTSGITTSSTKLEITSEIATTTISSTFISDVVTTSIEEPVSPDTEFEPSESLSETDITEEPMNTDTELYNYPMDITEYEYILLCNCVAYEYGSDWVDDYEKAKVVEVIMNRVSSDLYPNTIYDVLTQPNQFSGVWSYVNYGTYSEKVTDSVKNSVNLYFAEPESFNHGYTRFEGDGTTNYFS